jgi:hypothetical protein
MRTVTCIKPKIDVGGGSGEMNWLLLAQSQGAKRENVDL